MIKYYKKLKYIYGNRVYYITAGGLVNLILVALDAFLALVLLALGKTFFSVVFTILGVYTIWNMIRGQDIKYAGTKESIKEYSDV